MTKLTHMQLKQARIKQQKESKAMQDLLLLCCNEDSTKFVVSNQNKLSSKHEFVLSALLAMSED